MSSAVMGISRSEIESRHDEIAAFADIGSFIEQPIKTYSSGIYVRLAFAVVVNVSPDILVVDEALSVGDARFRISVSLLRSCRMTLEERSRCTSLWGFNHIFFAFLSASRCVKGRVTFFVPIVVSHGCQYRHRLA